MYQALADAIPPDDAEQKLDEIFEQFLGTEKSLQEKASVLEANGFDCKIEQSSLIEKNATLSCRRLVTGAPSCIGLRYFSYQTAEGQTIEAIGDSYVAKKDIWGRCSY